jgi:hypothetical protein
MFNIRPVSVFGLLLSLLVVTAAAAQPGVRAGVPDNDVFAEARQLVPGTSHKIKNPSAATLENDEPGQPCGGVNASNSVWFRFTPVADGTLYLSIAGTTLINPLQSTSTAALTVYSGATLGSLSKIDCNYTIATSWGTDLSFNFYAGTTYHVELSTVGSVIYTNQSYYKLTTRLIQHWLLPNNYGFESPISADNWKLKNWTSDTAACGVGTHPWIQGSCSFKFTSSPNESASLSQTVGIPSGIRLRKNGLIYIYLYYLAMETPTIDNAKITVTLIYSSGAPSQKITINLSGTTPVSFAAVSGIAYLTDPSLSKVKIKINHKSKVGALVIDNVAMYYAASGIEREAGGLLAVPPAVTQ